MDHWRFDALARLVSRQQSRRAVLAVLFGAAKLDHAPLADAGRARTHRKGKKRDRKRARREKRAQKRKRRQERDEDAPGRCCSRSACVPGPGKNLRRCCFEDRDLTARTFQDANLGGASFARADLTAANFAGANLDRTCFVDANTTGTRFGNANRGAAIFCRTETASGIDNSGCGRGTPCCPTCDAAHPCGPGQVCCDGRCIPGECCVNGEQSTCAVGEFCCNGQCEIPNWANLTVFGDQANDPNRLRAPMRVAVSADEQTAWVIDTVLADDDSRISVWKRESSGAWVNEAQFGCDGSGQCPFILPFGVAVSGDGKIVLVGDQGRGRITVWNKQRNGLWTNSTNFGTGPGRGETALHFPTGVAIAGDGMTAWVADSGNSRISVWTESGGVWSHAANFGSGPGHGPGEFDEPVAVAVAADEQTAWVVDRGNSRVSIWARQVNWTWVFVTEFGSFGDEANQFAGAVDVTVSSDGQTAWVADSGHNRISIWARQANGAWAHVSNFGDTGADRNQFAGPKGVAAAADGQTIWVADEGNRRISVWGLIGCPPA